MQRIITALLANVLAWGIVGCQSLHISSRSKSEESNYQRLETFLQQKNYRNADRETLSILLKLANREAEGWLREIDIKRLSCQHITAINWLWHTHSRGRFGWGIQQRIWKALGGTPGIYDESQVEAFGSTVGWLEQRQWKSYDQLTFSPQAPIGHLPASTGNKVSGGVWGGVATLSQQVSACTIWNDLLPKPWQTKRDINVQKNQAALRSGARHCRGCDLFGADLRGIDLSLGNLELADFRQADLRGAILGAAKLKLADFRGANLEGAILRQANLAGASFEEANLAYADFHCGAGTCTFLDGVSFQRANLASANLSCLDCGIVERQGLKTVNLTGANLTGASLEKTSLKGVNLCHATLPDGSQSSQVCPPRRQQSR